MQPDGLHEFDLRNPRRYKVFVKYDDFKLENLSDYILLLKRGDISEKDHETLFQFLDIQKKTLEFLTQRRAIVINHNLDVNL